MRRAGILGSFLGLGGLIAGRIGLAMTDLDLYPVAAATVAIGVLMLAFSEWQMRSVAAWIPLTFALSLVVGSIGTFVAGTSALFILSGILFGGAFAAMARLAGPPTDPRLWTRRVRAPGRSQTVDSKAERCWSGRSGTLGN